MSASTTNNKPVANESVIRRLTTEGFISFLGHGVCKEIVLRPGCDTILSNEAVADLNYAIVWDKAGKESFEQTCAELIGKKLPFCALVFPGAAMEKSEVDSIEGLEYAVDFPFMVLDEEATLAMQPRGSGESGAEVSVRLCGAGDEVEAAASASVVASAFQMPEDATLRALPASVNEAPSVDVYLAVLNGTTVGSVTFTYHGDACGVWAMATKESMQKRGIGRALLSAAIAGVRDRVGSKWFFLGATPAGYGLYESLGFRTKVTVPVWVLGETHQS